MILLSIKCIGTYGGAGMAEYIGQAAIDHGWKSYIAYARNLLPTKSNFLKIGNKWDIYEHVIETRLFDNHGFASRKATKKLIEDIELIRPDIIHLHNLHGYYINIKILFEYLGRANIPVVWTLHDCWMFTGHCSHFVPYKCYKWKSQCEKCPAYKDYPKSWFFDRSYTLFKLKKNLFNKPQRMVLVPVSKWIANFLPDSFMSNYPIKLIYNGVDIELFKPSSYRVLAELRSYYHIEEKIVILGVANTWSRSKGWDDFLKLSSMVDDRFVMIMVGLSDKQIKELPSNIIGIRRTNNIHEMVNLYSLADVFWNPTYIDTFPTTTLEALACGTPCVVYRTGGCPEAINEKTGFVVEQGDVTSSISLFKRIVGKEKSFYSKECRKRAVECFNKNTQFNKYIKLYESLLKGDDI